MVDRKRLQQIKNTFNEDKFHTHSISRLDLAFLFDTINDLQDEVGSLDEQLDMCRREGNATHWGNLD